MEDGEELESFGSDDFCECAYEIVTKTQKSGEKWIGQSNYPRESDRVWSKKRSVVIRRVAVIQQRLVLTINFAYGR